MPFSKNTPSETHPTETRSNKDHGVQVLLGADAVHRNAPGSDRVRWLSDVQEVAESLKIPHVVWAWDGEYGIQP
ncbi:hypothetical protein [Deinococcus misasensis]|uniref:hypothetical protein n=1 Tax=Deinococcus misasensis TaxID=392413 RepID=UPI0005518C9C|nr:hypothetical protein [Deinococcus misasensis]